MRTLRHLAVAAIAAAAALSVPAPAAAEGDHPLLGQGKTLYKQFCSHCHGVDMVNPGTGSYDLRRYPTDRYEDFASAVMNGKGSMPAWGDILLPDELSAIWVYVATRAGKDPFPETATAEPAPPPETALAEAELAEPGTLRVCLAKNGGAMSGWRARGGAGLDYRVAEEVARRMDLTLAVTWFETEAEEESDPVREVYALLAFGLCDVSPGHPLYEGAVGDPVRPVALPPRWIDRPATWQRELATLEPVAATSPYMRAEIGLVVGPAAEGREVRGFADLTGLRLGIQQGTLSAALAREQAPADVVDAMTTFPPGASFLWLMETGAFDVAPVDVASWDFHQRQNPATLLRLADWRHPLGFNIGMAVLAKNEGLLARLNTVIEAMTAEGVPARLAVDEGLSYAPPRAPWMQPRLTRADLRAEEG